jgi:predicted RNA-binding protein with PIN domain
MLIEGTPLMGGAPDRRSSLEPDLKKDPARVHAGSEDSKASKEATKSRGPIEPDESIESKFATMPRTILVDGFNVLHAVLLGKDRADGWWRRKHRERLLERLCEWRGGPDQIWVAFDGTRPAESVWAEPVATIVPPPTFHSSSDSSADSSADSPADSPADSRTESQAEGRMESQSGGQAARAMLGAPRGPTIHTVFVESADDWIVRRARRAEDPRCVIVVSADRKVAGRARSAGCEILTPWTFMGGCGPAPARQQLENGLLEPELPDSATQPSD